MVKGIGGQLAGPGGAVVILGGDRRGGGLRLKASRGGRRAATGEGRGAEAKGEKGDELRGNSNTSNKIPTKVELSQGDLVIPAKNTKTLSATVTYTDGTKDSSENGPAATIPWRGPTPRAAR